LSLILGGNPREGANVLLDVTRYPEAPPQARQDLALAYGLLGNTEAAAEILGRDLPKASVQDNLRYYEIQRQRLLQQPVSSTSSPKLRQCRRSPYRPQASANGSMAEALIGLAVVCTNAGRKVKGNYSGAGGS
jgi:hypothetical protein